MRLNDYMQYQKHTKGYMSGKKRGIVRTDNPTYHSYSAMISRCYVVSYKNYHRWGGRGIKVCERWLGNNGFANFLEDMGERPSYLSLERVDLNGNYEPGNCRWATQKEQMNNTSFNILVDYGGISYTIAQLSEKLGMKYGTVFYRVKNNVSLEKPVTSANKKHFCKWGHQLTDDNRIKRTNGKSGECLTCARLRAKKYREVS